MKKNKETVKQPKHKATTATGDGKNKKEEKN